MTAYELMIKTNHHLMQGGVFTAVQAQTITRKLLAARNPDTAQRFYTGVRYAHNTDAGGRRMYPEYYIPPYNEGKKYKTLMNVAPKTHILSANLYELEILRLLYLLAPKHPDVLVMTTQTLTRLRTTCFGNQDDGMGECFDASMLVLRFLATTAPGETQWMQERIDSFHHHFDEKHRHWGVLWYFWLCLSELPMALAEPEIQRYQEQIVKQLQRSYVMNSPTDIVIHPVIVCVIRNVMARLPAYAYIKERKPYISERDNRLHLDIRPSLQI